MKNLTCDKAEAMLPKLDSKLPKKIKVLLTAYSNELDAYFVKWIDPNEVSNYKDVAADMQDPDQAERVYDFNPEPKFSSIFFNEDSDGGESPAVEHLTKEDVERYVEHGARFVMIDKVTE